MILFVNMIKTKPRKKLPTKSVVYDTYWKFAAERQNIFFKRLSRSEPPWTQDPILGSFKFTNAYRASDRVSQFLIKEVIYAGDPSAIEVFFRTMLFKIFNKIETWNSLEKIIGELRYSSYSFQEYDQALQVIKTKDPIYSGAYIMASGKSFFGYDYKHQNHLKLLEKMIDDKFHEKLSKMFNMKELYEEFIKYPTIGSFLAYQYSIDINYSDLTSFSEMEFVKAGPGALDGIKKCFLDFGDYTQEEIIKLMCDRQEQEFERLGLNFKNLWGRKLQLIDCQNLFCEVDKYSRIAHPDINGVSKRKRIKQKFKPVLLSPIQYYYPPSWNINPNTDHYD